MADKNIKPLRNIVVNILVGKLIFTLIRKQHIYSRFPIVPRVAKVDKMPFNVPILMVDIFDQIGVAFSVEVGISICWKMEVARVPYPA